MIMLSLFMLALSDVGASFLFFVVVFFFFLMENLCTMKIRKRELIRVDTNHCNQCLCGLEENPTFSVNNSKVCGFRLSGNFAVMRQGLTKFLPNDSFYFSLTSILNKKREKFSFCFYL